MMDQVYRCDRVDIRIARSVVPVSREFVYRLTNNRGRVRRGFSGWRVNGRALDRRQARTLMRRIGRMKRNRTNGG